jgi:3-hydroxyisobutyrate dehydrogenase
MGSRLARRLAAAGHAVTVWNRTPAAAAALRDVARVGVSPRAAVVDAEFAFAVVRDDEASRRVWLDPADGALAGIGPGAIAIESSTLSVDGIESVAAGARNFERALIEAPVVGSRPQAEAGQLVVLAGGAPAVLARAAPVFAAFAGTVHPTGAVGTATRTKLLVNALFAIQVAALAELMAAAAQTGLAPEDLVGALAATPVLSPAARGAAGLMLAGRHGPLFPLGLVAKDLGYAAALAASAPGPLLDAVRAQVDRAIAAGRGEDNITALAGRAVPGVAQ